MISKALLSILQSRDGWDRYGDLFTEEFWDTDTGRMVFTATREFWETCGASVKLLDDATLDACLRSKHPKKASDALQYIRSARAIPKGKRDPLVQRAMTDWAARNELFKLIQVLETGEFSAADAAARMDRLAQATTNAVPEIIPAHKKILQDVAVEAASQVYPTGIEDIDRLLVGGLWAGELGIAFAPSSRGKTWYLVNQGANSLLQGVPVQHHTFKTEVNDARCSIRYYQNLCRAGRKDIMAHRKKYSEKLKRLKLPMWQVLEHEGSPTTGHIRQHVLRFIRECKLAGYKKPPLIIVDYLGLISPVDKRLEGRFSYQARTKELRHIAASCGVGIWTAHQTNRGTFNAQHIGMEDSSEDIGVVWTSDVIITLNQTPQEELHGVQRWYIAKAREREFAVRSWPVNAIKSQQRFIGELTPEQEKVFG